MSNTKAHFPDVGNMGNMNAAYMYNGQQVTYLDALKNTEKPIQTP
jgi:hypothetical protein